MSYGLEVYDNDGVTTIIAPDQRFANVLAMQDISISAGQSVLVQCDMNGTTASNSTLVLTGAGVFTTTTAITITRETTGDVSTQGFTITSNTGNVSGTAVAVRW